ncbi:MAG: phage methylase [Verrucomicrobiales bacterium]|nr:phage methylase [Verrucomicrobiales bacterium]
MSSKCVCLTSSLDLTMFRVMRYPGGKFRCYQKLINLIPPHSTYIETHLGGGAVLRHKKAAEVNIGIDLDPAVMPHFDGFGSNYQFQVTSAEEFLAAFEFEGGEFVYSDPPYWPASRRSSREIYRHTYTERDHLRLLEILRSLPCAVMLSGYDNSAYSEALQGWRKLTFTGTSHTGRRQETVWMNYEPALLHETTYLGDTFRDRQTIKRKRLRWAARFTREPLEVRQAVLSDLSRLFLNSL